ncbi:hypothetical protein MA6G0728R_0908 [Mycobacteroides abscessus 6G-0728-R]|nr:hypothetical protein MA6G0125R_5177 [Mycobacteroides abscessus 6G-0125-R]EIU56221.1 hypothetical protein MA6G0728S_1245 [Mycobacteroides abscessus 6G-0728-S]EIV02906.1 hypothetical protein MA6G0728R_0908 [Mycobacteroides abscessus 6G-0728-R]EIV38366.1 hypothetical protein MA3A0122R_1063 [Mycobacteroides abscessus 3A-0122-R]EIV42010.1 hypothetical protein MA3A0731_0813 [Mycobacteroides abscessus 3A-0731]EIV42476.1 hypothetical protein MA3A0122S_0524 [Mycobacteroides abscessus 3A-0122-S]EIV5
MRPVLELVCTHPEWGIAANFAEQYIRCTDAELSPRITHRRAAVTAATGLVEHHRAMFGHQRSQQFRRSRREFDAIDQDPTFFR